MQTEIEAKWLDINHDEIRKKLNDLGAELIHPERLMKRTTLDFPDKKLDKQNGWVRVRDEGDKVTLSYKQLNDRTLHGTKEINIVVNDYDATIEFLESIGLQRKSYQETKRESWKLENTEIELDTWPWIPSFVEIEAPNEQKLKETANQLGFELKKALHGSVENAYQAIYDVTDEDIYSMPKICFIEIPKWLEERKIKK